MSKLIDDVREQNAQCVALEAKGDAALLADAQRELLRRLGLAMKAEEASFDCAHGFARILGSTDAHGEVRLTVDGVWTIGEPPESLLERWPGEDLPPLAPLLEAIPKTFSSARIGALVDELRNARDKQHPAPA